MQNISYSYSGYLGYCWSQKIIVGISNLDIESQSLLSYIVSRDTIYNVQMISWIVTWVWIQIMLLSALSPGWVKMILFFLNSFVNGSALVMCGLTAKHYQPSVCVQRMTLAPAFCFTAPLDHTPQVIKQQLISWSFVCWQWSAWLKDHSPSPSPRVRDV